MADGRVRLHVQHMKKLIKSAEPRLHSRHIQDMLEELIDHLRYDVTVVKDARLEALMETSREVVKGLRKAYKDFDKGVEKAFRGKVTKSRKTAKAR